MSVWPSKQQIHADTGADRKTIIEAIKQFLEYGLIEDTGDRKGNTKQIVVYRLKNVARRENESGPITVPLEHESVPETDLLEPERVPKTEGLKGPKNGQERVPKTDRKGSQKRDTESTKEPTKEPIPPQPPTGGKAGRPKLANRFDEFWTQWPKKEKRKRAVEIWKNKNLDGKTEELIADVIWRKQNCYKWTRGFIPNITTYLNQELWTDERINTRQAIDRGLTRQDNRDNINAPDPVFGTF